MHNTTSFGGDECFRKDSAFMVPSAWCEQDSVPLWIICGLYWSLAFFGVWETIKALRFALRRAHSRQHHLDLSPQPVCMIWFRSFRVSILGVNVMFCLLRGLLTLVYVPDWTKYPYALYLGDFLLPLFLQYWVFSLLILFVVQALFIVHETNTFWSKNLNTIFQLLKLVFLTGILVGAWVLEVHFKESGATFAKWDQAGSLAFVITYFLLAVAGAVFTYKGYIVVRGLLARPDVAAQRKLQKYLVGVVLFLIVFAARFLWALLYLLQDNPLQRTVSGWMMHNDSHSFYWSFCCFYGVFEVVPSFVVILIFKNLAPSTDKKKKSRFPRSSASPLSQSSPSSTGNGLDSPLLHHHQSGSGFFKASANTTAVAMDRQPRS